MSKRILILGINGFIGSHLLKILLERTQHQVIGLDIASHKIKDYLNHPRFEFREADMRSEMAWIEKTIQTVDTVLPLVAIANPQVYVDDPLRVYELDFEANIPVIRWCATYQKHLVFPSTSEVYGMCTDPVFDEYSSNLVLGPVTTPRWIYACSKQLLDRFILALYQRQAFPYTLFRPFNWYGPGLDEMGAQVKQRCRVITQFINQILRGENLTLVDGGQQKRAFTYIDDGVEALFRIIENKGNAALGQIFNIGNPHCQFSIAELADLVLKTAKSHPAVAGQAAMVKVHSGAAQAVYGEGYQDVPARVPNILNAKEKLGWEPKISLEEGLNLTWQFCITSIIG